MTTDSPPSFRAGLVDVAPVLVGLVPFALVLGALAAAKGMSPLAVMLMSGIVFAGGSQFAAVELWRDPAPGPGADGAPGEQPPPADGGGPGPARGGLGRWCLAGPVLHGGRGLGAGPAPGGERPGRAGLLDGPRGGPVGQMGGGG